MLDSAPSHAIEQVFCFIPFPRVHQRVKKTIPTRAKTTRAGCVKPWHKVTARAGAIHDQKSANTPVIDIDQELHARSEIIENKLLIPSRIQGLWDKRMLSGTSVCTSPRPFKCCQAQVYARLIGLSRTECECMALQKQRERPWCVHHCSPQQQGRQAATGKTDLLHAAF